MSVFLTKFRISIVNKKTLPAAKVNDTASSSMGSQVLKSAGHVICSKKVRVHVCR